MAAIVWVPRIISFVTFSLTFINVDDPVTGFDIVIPNKTIGAIQGDFDTLQTLIVVAAIIWVSLRSSFAAGVTFRNINNLITAVCSFIPN